MLFQTYRLAKNIKDVYVQFQGSVRKKSHPILQLGVSLLLPEDNLVSSNFKLYVHSLLAGNSFLEILLK